MLQATRCLIAVANCGQEHTLPMMYMLQGFQSCILQRSHRQAGNLRATDAVLWPQLAH